MTVARRIFMALSACYRFCSATFLIAIVMLGASWEICAQRFTSPAETARHDPWNKTQVIVPEALAKVIAGPASKKPLLICVGFDDRYGEGHIPGAQFIGPGSKAEGIEGLKAWARGVSRP